MEFIVDPITLKYNDLVEIKHPKSKSRLKVKVTTNEQMVAPDRWRITEASNNIDSTGVSFKANALMFDKNEQQYFRVEDVKELSFFVKKTISPYRSSFDKNIELDKYLFIMHEKDLTKNFYSETYSQEEFDKIILIVKNCLKEWRIIPGQSEDVVLLKSELLKLLRNRNDSSLSEFINSPSGEIFVKLLPKNIQNKLTLNCFKTN